MAYACPLEHLLSFRLVCVGNWPLGTEPLGLPSYWLPTDSVLGRHSHGLRGRRRLSGPWFSRGFVLPSKAAGSSCSSLLCIMCFPPEDGTGFSLLPGPGCLTFLTNCLHPENPLLKEPHLTLVSMPSVSCQAPEQSSWSQEQ